MGSKGYEVYGIGDKGKVVKCRGGRDWDQGLVVSVEKER